MNKYFKIMGLLVLLLFVGCGEDRAGGNQLNSVESSTDTDGDGLSDVYETANGLDLNNTDSDGDGLSDGDEVNIHHCNPVNIDSDGDGLDDGVEINNGTDPNDADDPKKNSVDSDGDGLSDDYEEIIGTAIDNNDSDGDGLTDGDEISIYGTNPIKSDSDDDGLSDREEITTYESNATNSDSDGDGLSDGDEVNTYLTNPIKSDTDGDGLNDGVEIKIHDSNATNSDSDGDGLTDGDEVNTYETNPTKSDTDGDGLDDGVEITNGTDPNDPNDPKKVSLDTDGDGLSDDYEEIIGTAIDNNDSDGDGLTDGDEVNTYETNPIKSDSDGDGLDDKYEIDNGLNPNSADTDGDGLDDGKEINSYESNATNADTDGDGLSDGDEVNTYLTDLKISDTDSDGLDDKYEVENGLNPKSDDTDGDGLNDGEEVNSYESNASNSDSDGDGLNDADEVNIHHTSPIKSDSDGDGLDDKYELDNGLNPNSADTDGDGLDDGKEINSYESNATNADTDGDGLSDGDEINTYFTDLKIADTDSDGLDDKYEVENGLNPNDSDSDADGLSDGDEVNTHSTDPLKSDSDGDCLLDKYEIVNYHTNPNNVDSDADGVEDGIEIYSTGGNDLNVSCLSSPETLFTAVNSNPETDNLPASRTVDSINALDPLNDSDGDGQVNIQELNCTEGDPKDVAKMCPWLIEDENGTVLSDYGFGYLPGGFDVDGDGIEEGGFWVSSYPARSTGVDIEKSEMISTIGKYNTFIQDHFEMVNATDIISEIITGYDDTLLDDDQARRGTMLDFSDEVDAGTERLSTLMPFIAMASLEKFKLTNSNNEEINVSISIPNLKQYTHMKKLLDADKANGGDGTHIRNGLLGIDKNVPLVGYVKVIEEFGTGYKEYLSSMMQMKNSDGEVLCTGCPWVESWMEIDTDNVIKNTDAIGANSTIDLGMGAGSSKDNYAVLVRAGTILDLTQGPAGIDSDTLLDANGSPNGISFRGATPYLY